jgi:deoxyribodipyrimidine photolyase-related protein
MTDWFWYMFVDGYDWVMVPNVIGMTLHADGGFVGTKPYAASANYINKMSDYCGACRYDPKKTTEDDACPYNALYWDFIDRNAARFAKNTRMALTMRNWAGRDEPVKTGIRARARALRDELRRGGRF